MDEIVTEARALFRRRMEEYWQQRYGRAAFSASRLAHDLKVPRGSVQKWVYHEYLPTKENFGRVWRALGFTAEEAREMRRAIERQKWLSRKGVKTRPTVVRPLQTVTVTPRAGKPVGAGPRTARAPTPRSSEDRVAALERRVAALERGGATRTDDHWTVDGMPFVLTAENFVELDGTHWAHQDTEVTLRLVQNLRKRLVTIAQFRKEKHRAGLLTELGQELGELWMAYQAAKSVVPIQYIETIGKQLLRERMT